LLISIIIAVFNLEDYIEETLNSLFTNDLQDVEIIIINDGSTDNTLNILDRVSETTSQIKVVHQHNFGLSISRNKGIELSKGDWILFLDGDDLLAPAAINRIKLKLNLISNLEMYCYTAKCFDSLNSQYTEADEFYARNYLKEGQYNGENYYKLSEYNGSFVASACLYAVKSSILKQGHRFLPNILHEDELFTRQLLLKVENLYFERNPIYLRRIRNGSITTSPISDKKIESFITISNNLYETPIFKKSAINFYKKAVKMYLEKNNSNFLVGIRLLFNYNFLTLQYKIAMLVKLFKLG
jgi:glycosyltransferase involved in cell wall biosynthesis